MSWWWVTGRACRWYGEANATEFGGSEDKGWAGWCSALTCKRQGVEWESTERCMRFGPPRRDLPRIHQIRENSSPIQFLSHYLWNVSTISDTRPYHFAHGTRPFSYASPSSKALLHLRTTLSPLSTPNHIPWLTYYACLPCCFFLWMNVLSIL